MDKQDFYNQHQRMLERYPTAKLHTVENVRRSGVTQPFSSLPVVALKALKRTHFLGVIDIWVNACLAVLPEYSHYTLYETDNEHPELKLFRSTVVSSDGLTNVSVKLPVLRWRHPVVKETENTITDTVIENVERQVPGSIEFLQMASECVRGLIKLGLVVKHTSRVSTTAEYAHSANRQWNVQTIATGQRREFPTAKAVEFLNVSIILVIDDQTVYVEIERKFYSSESQHA